MSPLDCGSNPRFILKLSILGGRSDSFEKPEQFYEVVKSKGAQLAWHIGWH